MARVKRSLKQKILEYSVVVLIVAFVAYVYFSFADQVVEIFKLSTDKDYTKLKEYLKSFGAKGAGLIALLEMMQMIVVFIPAEFVQISAGLAFPVYFALPICMFGVFLGSSAIFLIVRCLHLRLEYIESKTGKIEEFIAKINKDVSMTVIMYILFVMPLIPFGAIAYFASSSKIKYSRYAFVCTTGVIPSVLSSYVVGNVMYNYLGRGTAQFIIAVLVAVILMLCLLFILISIIKKLYFKKTYQRASAVFYNIVYFFASIYFKLKFKMVKKDCVKPEKGPYVILGRHTTFYDFYFTGKAVYPQRPTYVCNRYFFEYKKTSFLVKHLGAIPKRLFTVDLDTMRQLNVAISQKCPIVVYSEGRLSSDGSSSGALENTEKFIKKLGLDVYGYYNVGGYFAKPKWRDKSVKHKIDIYLKPLFTKEELATLQEAEIKQKLNQFFTYDETDNYLLQTNKLGDCNVEGLENVLYVCKNCKHEYTLTGKDNVLKCSHCHKEFVFDNNYMLEDGTKISDWYNMQKSLLNIDDFTYIENCEIAHLDSKTQLMQKCGKGVIKFDKEGITYQGIDNGNQVVYTKSIHDMPALAYGCNEEFEFYVDKVLIYFYPENSRSVVKWALTWDLLYENTINEEGKSNQ